MLNILKYSPQGFFRKISIDPILLVESHWTLKSSACLFVGNFDKWQNQKLQRNNLFPNSNFLHSRSNNWMLHFKAFLDGCFPYAFFGDFRFGFSPCMGTLIDRKIQKSFPVACRKFLTFFYQSIPEPCWRKISHNWWTLLSVCTYYKVELVCLFFAIFTKLM